MNKNHKKPSRFRNNRISVFEILLLLLHHPVLLLVFKQKLYLTLAWWLGVLPVFPSVFQQQLLSQLLPQ
jgi:hypothetical protein